jgi:hypothetical protein
VPSSEKNLGGDSGVSVTVGSPQIDAQGENAVGLTIQSACDFTGLTPVFP